MTGTWKDKKKHLLRDKFKGLYSRYMTDYYTPSNDWVDGEFLNGAVVVKSNRVSSWRSQRDVYFYGVNAYQLWDWLHGSHKYGQKLVNGQTRTSVRNYIRKGDFEAERKRPIYEKSLDWYFY